MLFMNNNKVRPKNNSAKNGHGGGKAPEGNANLTPLGERPQLGARGHGFFQIVGQPPIHTFQRPSPAGHPQFPSPQNYAQHYVPIHPFPQPQRNNGAIRAQSQSAMANAASIPQSQYHGFFANDDEGWEQQHWPMPTTSNNNNNNFSANGHFYGNYEFSRTDTEGEDGQECEDYSNHYESYDCEYEATGGRTHKQAKRNQTYFCDICKVTCGSELTFQSHLDGKNHNRKAETQRELAQQNTPFGSGQKAGYHCEVCNVECSGMPVFEAHLAGQKHQRAIKMLLKANKPIPALPAHLLSTKDPNSATTSELNAALGVTHPQERNDQTVLDKETLIELSYEEKAMLEQLVIRVEETLFTVSEFIETERGGGDTSPRLLHGIMRVGLLAKQLLLKSDRRADLVVLCSVVPTRELLFRVLGLFRRFLDNSSGRQPICVLECAQQSALSVSQLDVPIGVFVTLTCPAMRQWSPGNLSYYAYVEPPNALPSAPCLRALAEMRRTKFYQVRSAPHQWMNCVVKLIRDIRRRVPAWEVLNDWMIELVVESALRSEPKSTNEKDSSSTSPSNALKRLFFAISEGVVLAKGSSLLDPCEKLPVDVVQPLSDRDRAQLFASARYALRHINTNSMAKLLALDGSLGIPSTRHELRGPKRARLAAQAAETPAPESAAKGSQPEGPQDEPTAPPIAQTVDETNGGTATADTEGTSAAQNSEPERVVIVDSDNNNI